MMFPPICLERNEQMITETTIKSKSIVSPVLKVRDVAKILSLSRVSVQALIESGDLEASEISPTTRRKKQRVHVRITLESLAKFYKKRFGHELERALQNPFQN
jgi:hypothetical protein